jgi:hypothetical protein
MARTANVVQLRPETEKAFDAYVRDAETAMEQALHGPHPFLWTDAIPERVRRVRRGEIVSQFWDGQAPTKVPNGLIHDWIGAEFISGATVENVLGVVQNYDHHKTIYKPEVLDSALISRHGNDFEIHLRLLKKKVVTVVLDTDHSVHYWPVDRKRWVCSSHTTRVAEVENAGRPNENVLPPDTGHGFLWRLNSYWKFEEKKDGVYVECRGISLTRDVPFGLGWLIEPIIEKLPGESLLHTLEATRLALQSRERRSRHSSTTA